MLSLYITIAFCIYQVLVYRQNYALINTFSSDQHKVYIKRKKINQQIILENICLTIPFIYVFCKSSFINNALNTFVTTLLIYKFRQFFTKKESILYTHEQKIKRQLNTKSNTRAFFISIITTIVFLNNR